MTDDTCGYEDTTTGHPCRNPADTCPWHDPDTPAPDGGRPTKLTDERTESITTAIAEGKSLTSAARMAGVNRATVYNWIERGDSEDHGPFKEFFDAIERARGHGEDFYFDTAMSLAIENGDHRFIASLMKQRYGESWADAETGVAADIVEVVLPEDAALTRSDGHR